jgi:hypothetical protein
MSNHQAGRSRVPVSRDENRNPHASDANINTVATMPVDLVTFHNQSFNPILSCCRPDKPYASVELSLSLQAAVSGRLPHRAMLSWVPAEADTQR